MGRPSWEGQRTGAGAGLVLLLVGLWCVDASACTLQGENPEVAFPVDRLEPAALCQVAAVVNEYTTHRLAPPLMMPVPKAVYEFLLDHPVLTSVLVRQLGLGRYRFHQLAPGVFEGDDGAGGEGVVTRLYQDEARRIYHIRGSHRRPMLPQITGAAIVMLSYPVESGSEERGSVDTQITVYAKLDNPYLASLVRVFRPVLQNMVNNKLTEPVLAVHRLGEVIAADPGQALRQAEGMAERQKQELEALQGLLAPR